MPNTPVCVHAGASAYSVGSACLDGDADIVQSLLDCVGYAVEVPEVLIDPVTGLSGSGPAYVCNSEISLIYYLDLKWLLLCILLFTSVDVLCN